MNESYDQEWIDNGIVYRSYADGSVREVGVQNDDWTISYHPTPSRFRSDWNQQQYASYRARIDNTPTRSPSFQDLLQQQNRRVASGAGSLLGLLREKQAGRNRGLERLVSKILPNENTENTSDDLGAWKTKKDHKYAEKLMKKLDERIEDYQDDIIKYEKNKLKSDNPEKMSEIQEKIDEAKLGIKELEKAKYELQKISTHPTLNFTFKYV